MEEDIKDDTNEPEPKSEDLVIDNQEENDEIKPTDEEGKQSDIKIPETPEDKEETKEEEDLSKKLKPKKQVKFDEDSLKELVVTESSIKEDQQQKEIVGEDQEQQQIMKSPEPTKKKKIKKVKKSKEKSLVQDQDLENQQEEQQLEAKTDNNNTDDTATIQTALLPLKDPESSLDTTSTDLDSKADISKDTIIKVIESTEIPTPKNDQSKDDNIPLKHELKDIPKDESSKTEEPKDTSKDTTMPNTQTETPETLQIIPETQQDSPTAVANTPAASVGRVREETKVILSTQPCLNIFAPSPKESSLMQRYLFYLTK